MHFYQELLGSYNKLKARTLRINEASKNSVEAEGKARRYINLAISNATKDHYIVSIPEFGSNAKIYVARNGKQSGKVVIDNVLSLYPMAVADGSGNPLRVPAYFQFVGKFDKKDSDTPQPEQQQPMLGQVQLPNQSLFKASNRLLGLAKDRHFFSLPTSMSSPTWMQPGPMEDYQELQRKLFGPDPFSLESKINSATKVVKDELLGFSVAVPISEDDRQIVSDTFLGFVDRLGKLYDGTFTESDSKWISGRIINDRSGFWIKDPLKLPQGVSLSWRYSVSDQSHGFFRYLILTYNKQYRAWAAENKIENLDPILDINSNHFPVSTQELNNLRGKTAEQLRVVIHSLAYGDKNEASEQLRAIVSEYQTLLGQAYSLVVPYQEGYAAADSSIIDTLNLIKEIEGITGGRGLEGAINKLAWLEQYSTLKRKPIAITPVSNQTLLGQVSDLEELYDQDLASVLASNYKFTPEEIRSLTALGTKLKVGLKTYTTASKVSFSERDLSHTLSIMVSPGLDPFFNITARALGVNQAVIHEKVQHLERVSKLVNVLFSDIAVPGHSSKGITKANVNLVLDKLWANSEFEDLQHSLDLDKLDMSNREQRERIKALIEARLILATLDKYKNDPNWRQLISFLIYFTSGSLHDQLLEVRSLKDLSCLAVSHNSMFKDILLKFNSGKLGLRKSSSSISIIDPTTSEVNLNLRLASSGKSKNSNTLTTSLPYNMVKRYSRI